MAGYLLCADTEEKLLAELQRLCPEEFKVLDGSGHMQAAMPYQDACKLLPELRPDYSMVSTATDASLETLQPSLIRKNMEYLRLELSDGLVEYQTKRIDVQVREHVREDGSLCLTPVTGMQAHVQKEWTVLPECGLQSFCTVLERQCNRERMGAVCDVHEPVLRVFGDRAEPLVSALLTLRTENPQMLDGLIEVCPSNGQPLKIKEVTQKRPAYLRAANDISQLLQDHGYESASKFLDCSLEL